MVVTTVPVVLAISFWRISALASTLMNAYISMATVAMSATTVMGVTPALVTRDMFLGMICILALMRMSVLQPMAAVITSATIPLATMCVPALKVTS